MQNGKKKKINVPASALPLINEIGDFRTSMPWRLLRVLGEFVDGWQFLGDITRSVTFFGSARFPENDRWYIEARKLGKMMSLQGYDIITGGGPGIMEAGNRGVIDAKNEQPHNERIGRSIGLNIQLPYEQRINPYVDEAMGFHYFFTRKVMMAYSSMAYVYFPGGFGTLDEFFEVINLVENHKINPDTTIILVGKEFWSQLLVWFEKYLYEVHKFVPSNPIYQYQLVDTAEEAYEILHKRLKHTKPKRIL